MSINNKPKCAICETRLDFKKKAHYMTVFKTSLIDILNNYKSNSVRSGSFVCQKCILRAKRFEKY